jgi:Na+/H+ antiporter NhaD/arsenite permease-like protein
MKRVSLVFLTALLGICLVAGICPAGSTSGEDLLIIQGEVDDKTDNPLGEAKIEPFLDGKPYVPHGAKKDDAKAHTHYETGNNGLFMLKIHAPKEKIKHGKWSIRVSKPSFKSSKLIAVSDIKEAGTDSKGIQEYTAHLDVTLDRHQGTAFWLALAILIGVYVLISLELVHRTLAALLGAAIVLAITHTFGHFDPSFELLTFEQSLLLVDWNVIFLLMGMMVVVGVLKESGVFQWMAYKSFQLTKGRVFLLSAALCVVTAFLSAFLDNVTTMLLLTPVTIEIALVLGISPFALLLPEIMASNFGGTATLIGDPPNIMIGSYAGLTFNDFALTLTPVVIVTMVAQILYTKWYYGKDYVNAAVEDVEGTIAFLKEKYQITEPRILYVGGTVLLGVIVLFMLHGMFHMEVSVAALLGAALIVILNKSDIVHVLEHDVEWPSLVFFIMLFIIVGAAEETGILQFVADWILGVCGGNLVVAIVLILWTSAILSAIVDNIPFTATMLPVVALMTKTIPGAESGVLWWALALGACFGGNGTIIGASANVITTGIAEKAGHKISFYDFFKHGAPITFIGLVLATAYVVIFLQ